MHNEAQTDINIGFRVQPLASWDLGGKPGHVCVTLEDDTCAIQALVEDF